MKRAFLLISIGLLSAVAPALAGLAAPNASPASLEAPVSPTPAPVFLLFDTCTASASCSGSTISCEGFGTQCSSVDGCWIWCSGYLQYCPGVPPQWCPDPPPQY
ncbi:MAG TPA: hypothetical protein VOA87_10955 [Thermoanaerobaculia bacterium]|nr:hypothetical protein [Thermoanaerobaculia bacterium]